MYDQFDYMGRTMRTFGADIEQRLDDVYKYGASKRFGFDDVASVSSQSQGFDRNKSHADRELDRIEKEANQFLTKVGKMKG